MTGAVERPVSSSITVFSEVQLSGSLVKLPTRRLCVENADAWAALISPLTGLAERLLILSVVIPMSDAGLVGDGSSAPAATATVVSAAVDSAGEPDATTTARGALVYNLANSAPASAAFLKSSSNIPERTLNRKKGS